MSGGSLCDYAQYRLADIAESIQKLIDQNGKAKVDEDLYGFETDPLDKVHYKYPDNILEQFQVGILYLKLAQIYTQRIDWLVSGDDSEESFITRLNEDLQKLKQEFDDKLSKEGFTE